MDWDFQSVLASIPAALFRGYADGSVDLFDRKAETMTGYTREEFESKEIKWTDLIVEADRDQVRRAFVKALKSGQHYSREYRIRSRDGNLVWVHEQSRIFCTPDGRIAHISGLFFDITERKVLEESLRLAEQDFRIVVDNIPAVTFKGHIDGTVDMFDRKVEGLTGYPVESFGPEGRKWTDLIIEEDRRNARMTFIQALRTNKAYVREYRIWSASGRAVWIHERSHIVCDSDGRISYISGLIFDITERKELEATVAQRTSELQMANERLLMWGQELEHRNMEINLLGQMGDLLQCCNTSAEAHAGIQAFGVQLFPEDSGALFVFGESQNTLEAVAVWGTSPPKETVFPTEDCWSLRRGRVHGRLEIKGGMRCRHVADVNAAYICIPLMAHGSGLGVLHLRLSSMSSEKWDGRQQLGIKVAEHLGLALAKLKLQETLQHLSVRDPLTGLFNRRYMEESLARELDRAKRQNQVLAVLMVDIDHFKRFNDTFGHDTGDRVLRELAALFLRQIRSGDIACRYGGEEFIIVLPDAALEVCLKRAEGIRQAAKDLSLSHCQGILDQVTLSIGVATFPKNGATPEALLQNADVALYRAKKEGRDRVCEAING
jgi:diguanylate cyclase (GGDEF)-like protein/PAS domain S-box-containing protein